MGIKHSKEKIKITDLNDDCLESIFNYLNFDDLLNVGRSNTRFLYAARVAFKRKFSDKVQIKLSRDDSIPFKDVQHEIQCQRLILVFGDFISSIRITVDCYFSPDSYRHNQEFVKMCERIIERIFRHSLRALVDIELIGFPKDWLNKFSKPLAGVESVAFYCCDLRDRPLLLSEIFPKLKVLKMGCCNHTELKFNCNVSLVSDLSTCTMFLMFIFSLLELLQCWTQSNHDTLSIFEKVGIIVYERSQSNRI